MKQFNHLRKELRIRNNKNCSTVELDNVNVKIPTRKTKTQDVLPNKKIKVKYRGINTDVKDDSYNL